MPSGCCCHNINLLSFHSVCCTFSLVTHQCLQLLATALRLFLILHNPSVTLCGWSYKVWGITTVFLAGHENILFVKSFRKVTNYLHYFRNIQDTGYHIWPLELTPHCRCEVFLVLPKTLYEPIQDAVHDNQIL